MLQTCPQREKQVLFSSSFELCSDLQLKWGRAASKELLIVLGSAPVGVTLKTFE